MCPTGQQYCDGVVASVHMTHNAEFTLLEARPRIFYRDVFVRAAAFSEFLLRHMLQIAPGTRFILA